MPPWVEAGVRAGGQASGRAGAPTLPRGLKPRTVAACLAETREDLADRGGGARDSGLAHPTGAREGEWAALPPPLGGGGGAQTKGACAFKAGSPGAGGEGTSGSGVEGGCAGQQGRGRGPEALPRGGRAGGRDSGDARARSRTAGRPALRAGARGRGGAAAPGRRRPLAGEHGGAGCCEHSGVPTVSGRLGSAGGHGEPGLHGLGWRLPPSLHAKSFPSCTPQSFQACPEKGRRRARGEGMPPEVGIGDVGVSLEC